MKLLLILTLLLQELQITSVGKKSFSYDIKSEWRQVKKSDTLYLPFKDSVKIFIVKCNHNELELEQIGSTIPQKGLIVHKLKTK
jgi:hypothetical protein